nr:alanine transaminase [Burkholderiaceae bacterium]
MRHARDIAGTTAVNDSSAEQPRAEPPREFARIKRLPPYVFNITGELKMAARRRGEDII